LKPCFLIIALNLLFWYNINVANTQTDDTQIPEDGVTLLELTPPPPVLRKPEEIFDGLMSKIDPRFTLANRENMQAELEKVSGEERVKIMEDFNKAMALYDKAAKEYFDNYNQEVGAYRNCIENASRIVETEDAESLIDNSN